MPPAQSAPVTQPLSLTSWLSVKSEREHDGVALRVVNAAAGNPFGLRDGDLIIADCGESGAGPDADVSDALARGYAACLDTERDGERVFLIALAEPPFFDAPLLATPADVMTLPATLSLELTSS